jgi:hypothetical protein
LGSVEHGEPLQERDRPRFLAGFSRAPLLVLGREAVGIDDGGATLALANIAAKGGRLAIGEPTLSGETVLNHGAPKDQDIDAAIGAASAGVLRQAERGLGGGLTPWLDPRKAPGLKFGDDLAGDFVIEVRPLRAGAWGAVISGHRGSPRRAPETCSPAFNPSRQTRPALSL